LWRQASHFAFALKFQQHGSYELLC